MKHLGSGLLGHAQHHAAGVRHLHDRPTAVTSA
jgi:hypothetical protein